MMPDLKSIPELPLDEAFSLVADYKADAYRNKVSLSAGVYRDEAGNPWTLSSVREAKHILHDADLDHEYLPIGGSAAFLGVAKDLILGKTLSEMQSVISVQTISGTGANHLGAVFLAQQLKPRNVWFSDPTWSNHHHIWAHAAPDVHRRTYPYYDSKTLGLDFGGMMSTLSREAVENDVVILHACAHNPTGYDPSQDQWRDLADLFERKKLFAFFDAAYQGFATGDVEVDAWAVRLFAETLFNSCNEPSRTPAGMCVAQSFAKSFGLYGERVGAFHLMLPSHTPSAGAYSQLLSLTRAEISNPPLFGARIVQTVLADPRLREMWQQDLQTMSFRIKTMRALLKQEIEQHQDQAGRWTHLTSQIGMFSYTGLNEQQVAFLRQKSHIYLMRSGRASMCGVTPSNVQYIASAIAEACRI